MGLVRKQVKYRTRSGKTGLRSILVRAVDTAKLAHKRVKRFAKANPKTAALGGTALALGAGALGAHIYAKKNPKKFNAFRRGLGATMTKKVVGLAGDKAIEHVSEKIGGHIFGAIGGAFGGEPGRALGSFVGEHVVGSIAHKLTHDHVERVASNAASAVRRVAPTTPAPKPARKKRSRK